MIEGSVNTEIEAIISLTVYGPSGQIQVIDAVVDTGFDQFLTLPPSLVSELGLALTGSTPVTLADGSEVRMDVYKAILLWDDVLWQVDTYAADATPLVGMGLLHGHSLHVDVLEGGRVAIDALP